MEAEPEYHGFSFEPIQCDPKFSIKTFLLLLMSEMGRRIPDLE
jgi:hypothetical protein